jgi:hypothetical protein
MFETQEQHTLCSMTVNMRTTSITGILALSIFAVSLRDQTVPQSQAADLKPNQSVKVTLHGYVRDLACLMKFNEALKPTNECAAMCAWAGSPSLVVPKKGQSARLFRTRFQIPHNEAG